MASQMEVDIWLPKVSAKPELYAGAPTHVREAKEVAIRAAELLGANLEFAESLAADKDVVMNAVKNDGLALRFAAPELCDDEEVVVAAVGRHAEAWLHAGESLRIRSHDKDLFIKLVGSNGLTLQYADGDLKLDAELAAVAATNNVMALAYSHDTVLRKVSPDLLDKYAGVLGASIDKEFVINIVASNGLALGYVSPRFRSDPDVVEAASRSNVMALVYVPEQVFGILDPDVVYKFNSAVAEWTARVSGEEPKHSKPIVAQYAFQAAPHYVRSCERIVLAAVATRMTALKAAGAELLQSFPFMLKVSKVSLLATGYASDDVFAQLVCEGHITEQSFLDAWKAKVTERASATESQYCKMPGACKIGIGNFRDAPDRIKNNKGVALVAVSHDGIALRHASKQLKSDFDVVVAAVNKNGLAYQFASGSAQKDRTLLLAAVSNKGDVLAFAPEEFRDNKDVVLAAVTQNGLMVQIASKRLREDRDIALAACAQNGGARPYIAESAFPPGFDLS